MITLPFPGKDAASVLVRAAEFARILRAGITWDVALCAVVDDLVEHCDACPAPAAVVDAIRRFSETDRLAVLAERAHSQAERKEAGDWDHKCAVCQDMGWETYTAEQSGNSYAKACKCSLGQRMLAARQIKAREVADKRRAAAARLAHREAS